MNSIKKLGLRGIIFFIIGSIVWGCSAKVKDAEVSVDSLDSSTETNNNISDPSMSKDKIAICLCEKGTKKLIPYNKISEILHSFSLNKPPTVIKGEPYGDSEYGTLIALDKLQNAKSFRLILALKLTHHEEMDLQINLDPHGKKDKNNIYHYNSCLRGIDVHCNNRLAFDRTIKELEQAEDTVGKNEPSKSYRNVAISANSSLSNEQLKRLDKIVIEEGNLTQVLTRKNGNLFDEKNGVSFKLRIGSSPLILLHLKEDNYGNKQIFCLSPKIKDKNELYISQFKDDNC
jgi:hypothetical protein